MSLRYLCASALCVSAISAMAQINAEQPVPAPAVEPEHQIVKFGNGSSSQSESDELLQRFYFDQFRHAHDPLAPYFMFMSKDSKLALGIGGVFNATAFYDWNGTDNASGFIPYSIPMTRNDAQRHRIGTTVGQSAIFLRLFGKSTRFGWYQLYIKGKFSGGGPGTYNFQLSKAYASIGDVTAGYAETTFSDPAAQPNTVDPQGPNGELGETTMLVRYMHTFKGNAWTVAASAEAPQQQVPSSSEAIAANAYMPDFGAFLQYQWADGLYHVRASGIVRGFEYRDLPTATNHRTLGWGAHLSTVANPLPATTLYGAVIYGSGISSLNNDLSNSANGLDMLPETSDPGRMNTARSFSWYAALQYNYRPDLYSTVMFSETRLLPGQLSVDGDTYKYGLYGTANLFYNPTPRLTLGAEYNLGARKDFSGDRRWVNRIGMTCQYSF